jgi:hypothetical protein
LYFLPLPQGQGALRPILPRFAIVADSTMQESVRSAHVGLFQILDLCLHVGMIVVLAHAPVLVTHERFETIRV